MLLFTHHYPETYKPKSIAAAIWNEFGYVTVNGVNSNDYCKQYTCNSS